YPAIEAVTRVDAVAEDRPHALTTLAHIALAGGLAVLKHRRKAPAGVAYEDTHQVHDVRAPDHQVLPSAAVVLLGAAAQLQNIAELAASDQFLDALHARTVARLVGNRQLDVVHLAGADHLVRLGERARHRLLEEDARPGPGTADDHVAVRVEVAICDTDDLWFLFFQHLPIVGIGVRRAEALRRVGAALVVLLGNGDDLDVVECLPDNVESVAVVALARPADHRHAIFLRHDAPR